MVDDYFEKIAPVLNIGVVPSYSTVTHKKQLLVKESHYQFIAGNLYELGIDSIMQQ